MSHIANFVEHPVQELKENLTGQSRLMKNLWKSYQDNLVQISLMKKLPSIWMVSNKKTALFLVQFFLFVFIIVKCMVKSCSEDYADR